MGKVTYPPGAIFCRMCGYCLHGLPTNVCPECGRAFDPADPATFLARPRRVWVKRTIFWTIVGVLVLGIAYGGMLCWLYMGWRAEAGARGLATAEGGKVESFDFVTSDLSWLLPGPCRQWQQRVTAVTVKDRTLARWELDDMARCPELVEVNLEGVPLTTQDVSLLCRCRGIVRWRLRRAGLSGDDLAPLSSLPALFALDLGDNREMNDSACAIAGGLKSLYFLHLDRTAVTDAGMASIAGLQKLQSLNLFYCRNITDAAVPDLCKLTALRSLEVRGTRMTPDGIRQLRAKLPQCNILGP